jgi:hypothetical protein
VPVFDSNLISVEIVFNVPVWTIEIPSPAATPIASADTALIAAATAFSVANVLSL